MRDPASSWSAFVPRGEKPGRGESAPAADRVADAEDGRPDGAGWSGPAPGDDTGPTIVVRRPAARVRAAEPFPTNPQEAPEGWEMVGRGASPRTAVWWTLVVSVAALAGGTAAAVQYEGATGGAPRPGASPSAGGPAGAPAPTAGSPSTASGPAGSVPPAPATTA
ncbi:hypothetical protein ACFV9B_39770, partial [Kitasatospora purpeofusca]